MLKVKNLSISYGDKEVVHNISFTVPKGSNLIIIGPNGCGKTTILRAIAGLMPYTGDISYNGKQLDLLNKKEKGKLIALMSQFSAVNYEYTIEETVQMGRYPHQKGGLFSTLSKEDKRIVSHCIDVAGLKGMEGNSVMQLSGGQLQRVFFARALAQSPSMILLDEPTNHLDLRYQAELIHQINQWSKEDGHMAVGVFHDINQAFALGDYGVVLKNGSIKAQGYLKDIITKDLLKVVFEMDVHKYMNESLSIWEQIK